MAKRWIIAGIVVSLFCGMHVNYVSLSLHPRFEHRGESIAKEFAIVRGESYIINGVDTYWPEFQNRALFGLALTGISQMGILRPSQWYLVLRSALAVATFFIFWLLLWKVAAVGARTAATATMLLALLLGLHFNHGWEHPSDFLDPIFMSGFIWAVSRRRPVLLAALAVAAALNRESAVFAGLLWFCVHGATLAFREGRRVALRVDLSNVALGVAIMAAGYASVVGFRYALGGQRAVGQLQHSSLYYWSEMIREVIATLSPTSWLFILLTILLAPLSWIAANRRWLSDLDLGLLGAAAGIFAISALFSLLPELRMLIPMTVILVFVAAHAEGSRVLDRAAVTADR